MNKKRKMYTMFEKYVQPNIKAIKILRDGQGVFEYFRDDANENTLFPVGCVFKAFLAALVGIAIYERKITSVEDYVIDYFSFDEAVEEKWSQLKIKHALSKTTGLIWPGPREPLPSNMQEVMRLKFQYEPGTVFEYKPDPQIIVFLLEQVYGADITEILKNKLLKHFKYHGFVWERNQIENMKVSLGVLSDFAQLMLNRGVIGKERLFSEEFFRQCTTVYSVGGFPECVPYGLGLWVDNKENRKCFYASGFGGQYLIVIPEKKMTITILSDMDRPHPENKKLIEYVCSAEI